MGCVVVPLPLRRRVPGCCRSKLFAPSLAFALAVGARLPLVPAFAGLLTTRPQDSSSYGPTTCSSPKATLSWRFDARVSPPAGHQLRGCLAITPTGLSPASPPPLAGHTPRQQVHGGLRRSVPLRRRPDDPHTRTRTALERLRRTVDRDGTSRMSRPDSCREPTAPRTRPPGLHPSLQRASPAPLLEPEIADRSVAAENRRRRPSRPCSATRRARRPHPRVQSGSVMNADQVSAPSLRTPPFGGR